MAVSALAPQDRASAEQDRDVTSPNPVDAPPEMWHVLQNFREAVLGVSRVSEQELTPKLYEIQFIPNRPGAAEVSVIVSRYEAIVSLAKRCRFELGTDAADLLVLRELLDAARQGRIEETMFRRGASYKIWFSDGTEHRSGRWTGWSLGGLIRGVTTRYEPYTS